VAGGEVGEEGLGGGGGVGHARKYTTVLCLKL
jgi:hypothetical protein